MQEIAYILRATGRKIDDINEDDDDTELGSEPGSTAFCRRWCGPLAKVQEISTLCHIKNNSFVGIGRPLGNHARYMPLVSCSWV